MFARLRKILGIESADVAGQRLTAVRQGPGRYLPESQVPENGIDGVADDGQCFRFWRTDLRTGERWFERISDTSGAPDVHAFAPADDAGDDAADDDGDELDPLSASDEFEPVYETDPETGERVYNAGLILRNAKARNRARERANRLLFRCDEPATDSDDDGDSQGAYQ
jgi:hypothetical protein